MISTPKISIFHKTITNPFLSIQRNILGDDCQKFWLTLHKLPENSRGITTGL